MTGTSKTDMSPAATILSWSARNRHFLIAAILLAATAGFWVVAEDILGWVMQKEAVTWPKGVEVTDDFRLASFPVRIGAYHRLADGEATQGGQLNNVPDGEVIHRDSDLETLGVGTKFDETRYDSRQSNWYLSRIYRKPDRDDPRYNPPRPYSTWRLNLTYYTGALDTVPHVPEVCLEQGGATVLGKSVLKIPLDLPGNRADVWRTTIQVNETLYEVRQADAFGTSIHAQYYFFSLNGRPQHDWKIVRWDLAQPWLRYCYFAKIQFSPMNPIQNTEAGKAERREEIRTFLNTMMPEVLRALPMPSDIERLQQSKT